MPQGAAGYRCSVLHGSRDRASTIATQETTTIRGTEKTETTSESCHPRFPTTPSRRVSTFLVNLRHSHWFQVQWSRLRMERSTSTMRTCDDGVTLADAHHPHRLVVRCWQRASSVWSITANFLWRSTRLNVVTTTQTHSAAWPLACSRRDSEDAFLRIDQGARDCCSSVCLLEEHMPRGPGDRAREHSSSGVENLSNSIYH